MTKNTKSNSAYHFISKLIYNKELKKGEMLEPEIALSKKIEISRVTLRRALDKLTKEGLLEKIPNKGYKVVADYSNIKSNNHKNAILFVHAHDTHKIEKDFFHMQIWSGIQKCAHEHDFMPLIYPLLTLEDILIHKDFITKMSSGIICDISDTKQIKELQKLNIPIVVVDIAGEVDKADMIVQDNFGGIKKAVKELKDRGSKKIGYLDSTLQLRKENRDMHAIERESSFLQNTLLQGFNSNNSIIERSTAEAPSVKNALLKLFRKGIDSLIIPFSEPIPNIEPQFWSNLPIKIKIISWGNVKIQHENVIYYGYLNWDPKVMGYESVIRVMQRIKLPNLNSMKITIPVTLTDGIAITSIKN